MNLFPGRRAARRALGVVCAVMLGWLSLPAAADETWYEVELIVFAQTHPDTGNEAFPPDHGDAVVTPDAVEVPDPAVPDLVIVGATKIAALAPAGYRLSAEETKLAGSRNYEVLLHTGWRQPGLLKEQAVTMHIHSPVPADQTPTETTEVSPPRLDGTVRLILSRYLHLDVDLRLLGTPEPVDQGLFAPPEPPEVPVYRLQESRRMRSKELHYLDNPMFGVVALVTPCDPPVAATAQPAPAVPATTPPPQAVAIPAGPNGGTIRR